MKRTMTTAMALLLAGCATMPQDAPPGRARVNPASIAAEPATWAGREVEVVGLLVWEFERLRLYQGYGSYCRDSEKSSIAVDWHKWLGVTKADNRRLVMVRGTFTNVFGVPGPDGVIVIGVGPGPLEPGTVVRWLSKPAKPCPKALP